MAETKITEDTPWTTAVERLRQLEVGEHAEFPASIANSVRSIASAYGFQWERVYRTKTDRERRVVTVTRIS